jgi:predicted RNase H-like HicB family nuclease
MSIEVRVVYHFEDGSWWADSEDAPGYYAGAEGLEELRKLVQEGLEFHFEDSVNVSDEAFEVVTRTRPRDDVEVRQTVSVCDRAGAAIILGSTQLTTSVSRMIKQIPAASQTVGPVHQPSAC